MHDQSLRVLMSEITQPMLLTLPPTQSEEYAQEHDAGMQRTIEILLGGLPGDDHARDAGTPIGDARHDVRRTGRVAMRDCTNHHRQIDGRR